MTVTTGSPATQRLARAVTDHLRPRTWIIAAAIGTGWVTAGRGGLVWAGVSALFAAIIPTAVISHGVRAGRWADRHLGVKYHRLTVMAIILSSVAVGIALMTGLGAPRAMIALTAAMFATLALLAAVTTRWKISVHAAVAAGATAMLTVTLGPAVLLLLPLVAAVGWSRVALRDHTVAQVIAGALAGTATAATVFSVIV